ncbi:MAG: sigma 54-interacting transcriptional regulator [Myxococcales bacterium]|nr:sigma 54-interacting transcriptional regulator [Myxococcales bacterium]
MGLEAALATTGGPVQFWESVVDLLTDAVFLVGPDHHIIYWNRAAEALTGYSREDVVGQPCDRAIHCTVCETRCGVFEFGAMRDIPLTIQARDGRKLAILKSATTLSDADGKPMLGIEVMRDVTTWNAREAATQDARRAAELQQTLLRSVLDNGTEGIVGFGNDAAIRFVSAPAEAALGKREPDVLGRPIEQVTGVALGALARRVLVTGERLGPQRMLIERGDGPVPVLVALSPMRHAEGQDGALLYVRDLTEEERRARELEGYAYGRIISRSPNMQALFELVDHVAKSGATILLQGESGTGKELVAREIHRRSRRAAGPFHAVNCAAIAPDLLESEFFGHERGAFTGATAQKLGRFEVAHTGTIFLDEVAELPIELQAKLLRVLEEQSFERVGGTKSVAVDVRIIAATHRDLAGMVATGRFREDLYYRLRVVPLTLPPLRERRADVAILAEHFLARIAERDHAERRTLAAASLEVLLSHHWPGNVRELANVMEYAAVVARGPTIELADLPIELRSRPVELRPPASGTLAGTARESSHPDRSEVSDEKARIQAALSRTHYNAGDAARLLGMHRTTLYRKRLRHGL